MPWCKNFKYTKHAHERINERAISRKEVAACWNDHHTTYTDRHGNPIYIADVEGRRIKVVVSKENNKKIITVGD